MRQSHPRMNHPFSAVALITSNPQMLTMESSSTDCLAPDLEIYPRFPCLRMLKLSLDVIESAILDELRSRLFKPERHATFGANFAKSHHSVEVARANIVSRFATHNDLLYSFTDTERGKVDTFQQWFADDDFVSDGRCVVNRQPVICP